MSRTNGMKGNEHGEGGQGVIVVAYLRVLKSLGAAHWVTQWVRWKTARGEKNDCQHL